MKFLTYSLFAFTLFILQLPSTAFGQDKPLIEIKMDNPRVALIDHNNPPPLDSLICGPCKFFIPKAFNPKAGQPKSEWKIKSQCDHTIQSFKLEVFSRWGELAFESNDPSQSWNGKEKGKFVQPGFYTYKISVKVKSNNKVTPAEKTGQFKVFTPVED